MESSMGDPPVCSLSAKVAGAAFEGGGPIIRALCKQGNPVFLVREPENEHDLYAVAVYMEVPLIFGLLGKRKMMIGYIKKGTANSLAKRLDAGEDIKGRVKSVFAPGRWEFPDVTLELDYWADSRRDVDG